MKLPDKSDSQPEKPDKNITPVVQAVQIKRPVTKRFLGFLLAESPKDLGKRIGKDIIGPRLKAGFEEAANSFLSGMLWGDSGNRPVSNLVKGTVLRSGATNYREISSGPASALTQAREANASRGSGNYEDLVCPTQQHAEMILAQMFELLNAYRVVAVADLYELGKIKPAPSDEAYGWYSLDGARISKVREGFVLELPRPSLI